MKFTLGFLILSLVFLNGIYISQQAEIIEENNQIIGNGTQSIFWRASGYLSNVASNLVSFFKRSEKDIEQAVFKSNQDEVEGQLPNICIWKICSRMTLKMRI